MMHLYTEPSRKQWNELVQRPAIDNSQLFDTVRKVIADIKQSGDKALVQYTKQFDGYTPESFAVTNEEIKTAIAAVPEDLKNAIQKAAANIESFHKAQLKPEEKIETMPGISCWRRATGIEKVGLYIPGGTAPLFSTVLMLGIPAKLAACKEIILCTPADKAGNIHPAIIYAAQLCGISKMYKLGGIQAIAAMAYGTESIPAVYKIFGPGNQYVTAAKQWIQLDGISIDMPAGPSEVCVYADETANAAYVAADLLSQAEHGTDSQVLLIASNKQIAEDVMIEIEKQLSALPRKTIAAKALLNSKAIILQNTQDVIDLINLYAPEHLILSCKNDETIGNQIINAGSVFLGNYSPESVGDYASGTNHTLPTNGFAKAFSGVSIDSFVKKITYQKLNKQGLQHIADTVITMADAEGLAAHAAAVQIRINS